jgi:hypothetical protein
LAVVTATILVEGTARHSSRAAVLAAVEMAAGNTILSIAAVPLTETEVPRIGLVVQHEATPFPIVRLVLGNRLDDREEIWPAIGPEETALAIGPAERVLETGLAVQALATGREQAERIGWEAGTSLAAGAETGMPSEEVPGARRVITDRARAPAVAAVLQAWDLEEAVAVVVAGGGEGKAA